MAKPKYYTVWEGKQPGVYSTWEECQKQVIGERGAMYKSFSTLQEAQNAFQEGAPANFWGTRQQSSTRPTKCGTLTNPPSYRQDTVLPLPPEVTAQAIAVDAACSKNPGPMEYRGIDLRTGAEVFHFGPILGTNNIGEFLAIVHCLAWLQKQGDSTTSVYSDSRNALLWIKNKKCRTQLAAIPAHKEVLQLVERASLWLQNNSYANPVLKWHTSQWGEIPADFGRK